MFGGSSVTGHCLPGHTGCAKTHPSPVLPEQPGNRRGGNPETSPAPQHQHLLMMLPKRLAAQWCLRLKHAGPFHLLVDSELTRKSCLVFLCFLRMSLKQLNSLSDLSVMRPAKTLLPASALTPMQTIIHMQSMGSCENPSQVISLLCSEPSCGSHFTQGQSQVLIVACKLLPAQSCPLLLHPHSFISPTHCTGLHHAPLGLRAFALTAPLLPSLQYILIREADPHKNDVSFPKYLSLTRLYFSS